MRDNNKEEREQVDIIPAAPGFNLLSRSDDDGIYRQPIIAWRFHTTCPASPASYCVTTLIEPIVAKTGYVENRGNRREAVEHPDGRCSYHAFPGSSMQFRDAGCLLEHWQEEETKKEQQAAKRRRRLSGEPDKDIVSIDGSGISELC
jgi:hypothetical protein